jgi:hypothetical protein
VHRRERVALQRQPLALAQFRGERIGDVRGQRQRGVGDPAGALVGRLLSVG